MVWYKNLGPASGFAFSSEMLIDSKLLGIRDAILVDVNNDHALDLVTVRRTAVRVIVLFLITIRETIAQYCLSGKLCQRPNRLLPRPQRVIFGRCTGVHGCQARAGRASGGLQQRWYGQGVAPTALGIGKALVRFNIAWIDSPCSLRLDSSTALVFSYSYSYSSSSCCCCSYYYYY